MKYKIKWCEVTKEGETNGRPWKMTKMTLVDEQGVETDGVTTFDPVVNGGEIEGEIVPNGQYLNFKKKLEKPNFMKHVAEEKKAAIAEAQNNKAKQIEAAQDRAAWMWAKVGATNIVANHNDYKNMTREEIVELIERLATDIYNLEPVTPF